MNQKYQSVLEVQFDRKKIIQFLDSKKIFSSLPKEIESFILPILIDSKNNELYYLNQNIFFNLWDDVSESHFLIKYVLPNEDIFSLYVFFLCVLFSCWYFFRGFAISFCYLLLIYRG